MNFTGIPNSNQAHEAHAKLSTLDLYLSETEATVLVVFVVLFGSTGFLLNLILILSIAMTDGFAEAPVNVFVLSLAFADLLITCVCPALLIYSMYHSVFSIVMTVMRFLVTTNTGCIFLLTSNRFVSIVRALEYPKIVTLKRTAIVTAIIWFVGVIVFLMSVLGSIWNNQPMKQITRYLVIFYSVSSIVMCMYMYHLSKKHKQHLTIQRYAVTGQMNATSDEFRALCSLFMVAASFVACWLPLTIVAFFLDPERNPVQVYRVFSFMTPLAIVNTVIDPIVYYYRSNGFRLSLKLLMRRFKNAGYCECC